MENQLSQTNNTQVAKKDASETKIGLQKLVALFNAEPKNGIDKTPDGKARTINISHVEMTLDEMFFGLWETENFKWSVISNEVVGSIDLVVVHPITGIKLKRTGAASIIIQMNKAPENLSAQEKSQWALGVNNKKANALDLGFPKLKAECLKNAAQSLGKLFGRDLNRGEKADSFNPLIKTVN